MLHIHRPTVGIGSESASHPGKDRNDLRYHLVERDWDVFIGRYPVFLMQEAAEWAVVDTATLDRPVIEKAVGSRPTPLEGDAPGTHKVFNLTTVSAVW